MKKILYIALAGTICLAACHKEESSKTGNDGNKGTIKNFKLTAPTFTRVEVTPGSGGSGNDVINWKKGDKIAFWEVIDKEDPSQSGNITPSVQKYNVVGTSKILFTLVSGEGTNEGIFSADGEGLDPSKLYAYSHATKLNSIDVNSDSNKKLFTYKWSNTQTIECADSEDAVNDGLTFAGNSLVRFENGEIILDRFTPMMTIWEINLSNAAGLPDFDLASISIDYNKGNTNNFGRYWEVSINKDEKAVITSGLSAKTMTIKTPHNPTITDKSAVKLRVPVNTRQKGTSVEGEQTLTIKVTATDGKVVTFTKTKPSGNFLFGKTYIIKMEIPTAPI